MSSVRFRQIRSRKTVTALACLVVVIAAAGVWVSRVGRDHRQPGAALPSPSIRVDGEAIRVAVAPSQALAVAVPGIGHLTAAPGAFTSPGRLIIRQLRADSPADSVVVVGDVGLDVSFEGTSLASAITVLFDDPAAEAALPKNAIPVVLHKPADGDWEAKSLAYTPAGVPYLSTTRFSPNLLGWIPIPDWLRGIGDSLADLATQRTDPRPCQNDPPAWSSITKATTLVHLCSITNVDAATKALRAEIQVQSNRRFYQWVSVPDEADYVWVAEQPDRVRAALGKITGHDPTHQVLLAGNGWFTAGFRQPTQPKTKEFNAFIDHTSLAFTVGTSVLGLDLGKGPTSAGLIVAQCLDKLASFPSRESVTEFFKCFVEESLANLANPGKAFSQAMDLYGEDAYAKSAEDGLKKATTRLQFLGKIIKVLGVAGTIAATYPQMPDAISQWGKDQPGRFTFNLTPVSTPPTTAPTSPTATTPPPGQTGTTGGPGTTTAPTNPATRQPQPLNPRIELVRGAAAPSGWWYAATLSGFAPGSTVTVTCRDSRDPGGFWNQTFTVGGDGRAGDSTLCYSGDGPDHWITGGGVESNHVTW